MRQRSIFAVGLVTSLAALTGAALTGCEDGPSQTFAPAPANAGNLWNNGNPDAGTGVFDGSAKFDAQFGSVNALAHCTADQQRLVWANMLQQPIIPPLQYAGLNLAYDTKFDGITLKEAEAINCTGEPIGGAGVAWGDNGEVVFFYTSSNYVINQIDLNLGYEGKMTFHQAVGAKGANGQCAIVSRFENSPTPDPDPTHCTGHTYQIRARPADPQGRQRPRGRLAGHGLRHGRERALQRHDGDLRAGRDRLGAGPGLRLG